MIRKTPALAVALALLAATTAAAARAEDGQPGRRAGGSPFERLDRNADGFVDRAEMAAASDRMFGRFDTDKDGSVSREEAIARMQARARARAAEAAAAAAPAATPEGAEAREARERRRAERVGQWFARLDGDGDGRVTREEFKARREATFARFDKDGDGRLSRDEMPRRRHSGSGATAARD